jgi:hypothetical protein
MAAILDLRREVECSPPRMLPPLAREAISLTDEICWTALEQGDVAGFRNSSRTAAALGDFTDNARLLPD